MTFLKIINGNFYIQILMKTFLNIKNELSQFLEPIYKFDKNILDSNIKDKLLVGTKYRESLTYLFQNLKMPGILTENSTNVM